MEKFIKLWDKVGVIFLIVIEVIIFTIGNPKFISTYTLLNILRQGSIIAIAALGYGIFLISGIKNLSIGAIMSLSAVVACLLSGKGTSPAIICIFVIVVSVFCSCTDSLLATTLNVDPFLLTLATMNIWTGLAFTLSDGQTLHFAHDFFPYIGNAKYFKFIPLTFLVLVVCACVAFFIMNYTHFGRNIYANGGNVGAAFLNGINVSKVRLLTAATAGVFMGISAILMASKTNSVMGDMGSSVYIDSLTASVLGGISIYGGSGKIQNVLLGVTVLQVLNSGLQMMGISSWTIQIIKGILLIFAFTIEYLRMVTKDRMLLSRKLG